ncbi:hypothetical protein ABR738_01730 [Streptomyces sp. Edi4]|uniref:hypothetical protein n=1 Tax=Streptomyces sp. Edi4 TaxID=3162527 RepID=UPI003305DD27
MLEGSRSGAEINAGLLQDLPDSGSGHLHAQDKQFTVQTAIPQAGIVRARRNTRARTECTVRGRPERLGREAAA